MEKDILTQEFKDFHAVLIGYPFDPRTGKVKLEFEEKIDGINKDISNFRNEVLSVMKSDNIVDSVANYLDSKSQSDRLKSMLILLDTTTDLSVIKETLLKYETDLRAIRKHNKKTCGY